MSKDTDLSLHDYVRELLAKCDSADEQKLCDIIDELFELKQSVTKFRPSMSNMEVYYALSDYFADLVSLMDQAMKKAEAIKAEVIDDVEEAPNYSGVEYGH